MLDTEVLGFTSRADWDLGGLTATYVLGYETVETFSRGDVDGGAGAAFLPTGSQPGFIPFPAETADGIDDHQQITHELRLSNDADAAPALDGRRLPLRRRTRHQLVFSYDTLANGIENGSAFQTQDTDSHAVFGNLAYDMTRSAHRPDRRSLYGRRKRLYRAPRGVALRRRRLTPAPVSVGDEQVSWDALADLCRQRRDQCLWPACRARLPGARPFRAAFSSAM